MKSAAPLPRMSMFDVETSGERAAVGGPGDERFLPGNRQNGKRVSELLLFDGFADWLHKWGGSCPRRTKGGRVGVCKIRGGEGIVSAPSMHG